MDPVDLYPAEVIDQLADAIQLGPVVVVGEPGTAREAVARAALRRLDTREPLILDPAIAGTLTALEADTAQQLIAILVDDPEPALTGLAPSQLRSLQRYAGPEAPRLLTTARGEGGASLDILLGLVGDGIALLVRDAAQLRRRWARDALWTIRGRAADDDAPRMVLLGRPHDTLSDTSDAFLGAATTVTLRAPSPAVLLDRLTSQGVAAAAGAHWIAASRCLPAVVAAALAAGEGDGEAGWAALVAATTSRRAVFEKLALEAHQLGPRLLDAIARRQPPYASAPGAAPALIAKALAALRDVDLITQPSARQWRIADPALETVLTSPKLEPGTNLGTNLRPHGTNSDQLEPRSRAKSGVRPTP